MPVTPVVPPPSTPNVRRSKNKSNNSDTTQAVTDSDLPQAVDQSGKESELTDDRPQHEQIEDEVSGTILEGTALAEPGFDQAEAENVPEKQEKSPAPSGDEHIDMEA